MRTIGVGPPAIPRALLKSRARQPLRALLKDTLIETIGRDHYRDACVSARRDADREDYGRGRSGNDDSSLTPHDISDELWGLDASLTDKITLLFEVYDEMPAYTLLMYVPHHFHDWPSDARALFWAGVRARLGGSDQALARPLAYSLWCDWFEHGDFTAEAWEALTGPEVPAAALQNVLIASGPVPWRLKTELYRRLVGDAGWHYHIFRSLLNSAFDVYGQIDRNEAVTWLDRLLIPESTAHLPDLIARLRR